MKIIINLLLLLVASSTASAQHFFEKSFHISFPNGQANRVAYLRFPTAIPIWGTIEVEITGGFNFQPNRGVLTKRFEIVSNGVNGFIDHGSEIVAARGALVTQWRIGEFNNGTFQIPIHHLVATGNDIVINVKGLIIHGGVAETIKNGLTLSAVSVNSGEVPQRSFRSFSEDRIGFGTKTPEHRLDIVGKLRAHEILVNTQKTADYVFEPDYELTSLDSLALFIKTNKHLPEIPSAKEMLQKDLEVGSFQIDLLKKIEELTLYVIDLQSQIREIREERSAR